MPSPAPSVHLFPPTHLLCNHGYRVRGACVECGGAGALGGVVAAAQLWPHAAQTHCRTAAARCVAMFVTWFLPVPCSSACSFACSKNKRLTKGRKGQKKKMYVPCCRVRWRSPAGTLRSAACVHNTPWPCARLSLQHRRSVVCCASPCVGCCCCLAWHPRSRVHCGCCAVPAAWTPSPARSGTTSRPRPCSSTASAARPR